MLSVLKVMARNSSSTIRGDDPRIRVVGGRCVRNDGTCMFDYQTSLVFHLAADDDCLDACSFELDLAAGGNGFDVLVDVGDGFQLHANLRTHWHWRKRKTFRFKLSGRPATVAIMVVKRTEPNISQAVGSVLLPIGAVLPITWRIRVTTATLHGLRLSRGYRLCEQPAPPERRIEFVGDSDMAALGSEGPATMDDLRGSWSLKIDQQNIRASWAYLLCGMLRAEPSIIAWSGVGVAKNHPLCGDTQLGEYYQRALATEVGSRHDFSASAWTPQLVLVQVGANDFFTAMPPPSKETFVAAYVALLTLIRSKRPAPCVLVCCLSRLDTPSIMKAGWRRGDSEGALQSSVGAAIAQYVRETGDDLVHLITAEEADLAWPDDGGVIEHWNVTGQAKYARNVRDTMERDGILRKLGWDHAD